MCPARQVGRYGAEAWLLQSPFCILSRVPWLCKPLLLERARRKWICHVLCAARPVVHTRQLRCNSLLTVSTPLDGWMDGLFYG